MTFLCLWKKVKVLAAQSCLTLCDPMDCSPHQAPLSMGFSRIILGWVAIPFSRGSSWLRDWIHVSCIGRWVLYHWATREALSDDGLTLKWTAPGGRCMDSFLHFLYIATEACPPGIGSPGSLLHHLHCSWLLFPTGVFLAAPLANTWLILYAIP